MSLDNAQGINDGDSELARAREILMTDKWVGDTVSWAGRLILKRLDKQAEEEVKANEAPQTHDTNLEMLDLLGRLFGAPGPVSEEAGNLSNPFAYYPTQAWRAMKRDYERILKSLGMEELKK